MSFVNNSQFFALIFSCGSSMVTMESGATLFVSHTFDPITERVP